MTLTPTPNEIMDSSIMESSIDSSHVSVVFIDSPEMSAKLQKWYDLSCDESELNLIFKGNAIITGKREDFTEQQIVDKIRDQRFMVSFEMKTKTELKPETIADVRETIKSMNLDWL